MKTLRGGALLVTLGRSHTTGMKSKVHPTYKTKYRVANWPDYNQTLVRRGDVTGRCCVNRNWHRALPTRRFVTDRSRTTLVDQARSFD